MKTKCQIMSICVILALVLFSGCSTLPGVAGTVTAVEAVNASANDFEERTAIFLKNWPLLSGVLEGYFEQRHSDITLSMREARTKLDEVWARGKDGVWDKRDLGLAFGLSCSLFNAATRDWFDKVVPKLMKLIPILAI